MTDQEIEYSELPQAIRECYERITQNLLIDFITIYRKDGDSLPIYTVVFPDAKDVWEYHTGDWHFEVVYS